MFREDCTADELIDVILGNRIYMPCLYVYNKIDQISLEEVNRIARRPHSVVVSCNMKLNLDYLLEVLWAYLAFIRVYTKKPGQPPDFEDCLILRRGVSVEHVCHAIHRTLAQVFKYALVWVSPGLFARSFWLVFQSGVSRLPTRSTSTIESLVETNWFLFVLI